jgi:Carboxypeptidase regulatory-like domain
MRMKLQRILRVAPLALMFASVASAQTTGNIIGVVTDAQSGKPIVGALVVATSPSSQGEQTAVTDKSGGFRFQLLQPGDYKLATSFDGFKPAERTDLTVRVDKTIRANLSMVPEAVQMEEQVVKTGVSPVINVGSAESGTVVSREFLDNIPGSRGFENIAITAPMTQFDLYGVSFAGASSPENGYLIDGMNVGDAAYGTLGGQILNNFVQEIDVKTGSFMPEYGFATGGILSVVTKSGSNEFHGSIFGNLTPGSLQADPKAISRNAEALARKVLPRDGTYSADFGAEVGGPILKDRLWFYAGFAPQLTRTTYSRYQQAVNFTEAQNGAGTWVATPTKDANGFTTATPIESSRQKLTNSVDAYQMVAKLTYLFNENNQVALSVMNVPSTNKGYYTPNASLSQAAYAGTDNFTDVVARYSSKLLDKKLQFELTGGYHKQVQETLPVVTGNTDGASKSEVMWANTHSLSLLENLADPAACAVGTHTGFDPCKVTGYRTGGQGYIDTTTLSRLAVKGALTYFAEAAGTHQVKGGVDMQKSTYDHNKGYTGPNARDDGGDFLGGAILNEETDPAGTFGYVMNDYRRYGSVDALGLTATDSPGGKIKVKSETTIAAYYLQDSWQPGFLDGLTINAGIRWETQSMGVPDQPAASNLSINNSIGPRIQAVYDWTRQGRSKVSASWGRFFASFPLDMADRAFGDERQIVAYRDGCVNLSTVTDKTTLAGMPEKCAVMKGYFVDGAGNAVNYQPTGSSATPVAPDIKSPYVDMFGGAVEYELFADLSVGFEYQGRRQGPIIEDMSANDGQTYFIANPSQGSTFTGPDGTMYDPVNVSALDRITRRTFTTQFPKPVRSYDGFTFSVKKNFSSSWLAQVSYTYSSLRGNYPGFFRPEDGQLDPGITSMFDLASLLANQEGPLPGDKPHSFKGYGSYNFDLGPRLQVLAGTALRVTSGTPVNYLVRHPLYGNGQGFALPRGSAGRTPVVTNLDLKGGVTYTITPPYKVQFTVDVFNILNQQTATSLDQNWTFGSSATSAAQVAIGGQCGSRNAVSKSNPISAALADCPDLQYLKGNSGNPVTINTNFGRPTAYQVPLSVRFGLELTF